MVPNTEEFTIRGRTLPQELEMNCLRFARQSKIMAVKTLNYGPIQWVTETAVSKIWSATNNIIVNVLGGLSRHLKVMMKELVGMKNKCIKRFDAILLLSLSSNS